MKDWLKKLLAHLLKGTTELPPPKVKLFTMLEVDMHVIHPMTSFEYLCSRCKCIVGLYPSGQKVLMQYDNVTIICNRCQRPNDSIHPMNLAPGALEEAQDPNKIWRKRGKVS